MTPSADDLFKSYRKHGDPVLLGRLYDLVGPGLLTLALHLKRDPNLAEDLVHDVFINAMEHASDWDPKLPLESWLVSLLAIEAQKSGAKNEHTTSLADLEDKELIPKAPGPLAQARASELRVQLDSAISRLPDKYRGVVRMGMQEGLTSQAIGRALDLPPATVRSRLARGLDRLRQMLPSALGLGLLCKSSGDTPARAFGSEELRFKITSASEAFLLTDSTHTDFARAGRPRTTGLVALGIALFGAGAFLYSPSKPSAAPEPSALTASIPSVPAATNLTGLESPGPGVRGLEAQQTAAEDWQQTHLFGRIVDHRGTGIPDAVIRLRSEDAWFGDYDAKQQETEETCEWTTQTDSAGRYDMLVPTPAAWFVEMQVYSSENTTNAHLTFATGNSNLRPLWAGERDMGTITLYPAGSVRGRILNADGSPAYPALVVLEPGCDTRAGCMQHTEPDGSFVASHLLIGEHGLTVFQDTRIAELPSVNLQHGEHIQLRPVTLPHEDTVTISVRDPRGQAIPGAILIVYNRFGDRSSWDAAPRTDNHGRVSTKITAGEDRHLEVMATGYATVEGFTLESGDNDVLITLQPVASQAFRAWDAQTQQPIEFFQMRVERLDAKGQWQGMLCPRPQAGSPFESLSVSIEPGDRFGVYVDGYQEHVAILEPDAGAILDIALIPAHRIEGRVLLDGIPQVGATVELSAGRLQPAPDGDEFHAMGPVFAMQDSCLRWAQTDANGRFSFSSFDINQSQYSVRASLPGGSTARTLFQVKHGETSTIAVGDLELKPAGTIRGRVLAPPGFMTTGLTVFLDHAGAPRFGLADASGFFEIQNVLPGEHLLVVRDTPELRCAQAPEFARVVVGETCLVELDLRSLGYSFRQLELTSGGAPLVQHRVYLLPVSIDLAPPIPNADALEAAYFGRTDLRGIVLGSLPCTGLAEIWIEDPTSGQLSRHATARVSLTCQPRPRVRADFPAASNNPERVHGRQE